MVKLQYREEIDGLRAIAVLSVIFFHANESLFPGGYLGVDIFFVISGYLISSIILTSKENNTLSILKFYEKRIRRIIPALLLMLFITLIVSLILFSPKKLIEICYAIINTIFFTANIYYSITSSYFNDVTSNPLIHTWSLSVEEQFYLIFPITVLLLYKKYFKFFIIILFGSFFLSLTMSQFSGNLSSTYPFIEDKFFFNYSSTFFDFFQTFGRVWELLIGTSCYFIEKKISFLRINQKFNNLIIFIGLLMVILPIFLFNSKLHIPGLVLLIPTVGTALIIIFYKKETFFSMLLTNKLMMFIGIMSYSLYLWHHPILVFLEHFFLNTNTFIYSITSILLISTFSFISWKYVETPFRKEGNISFKKLIIVLSSLGFLLLIFCYFILKNDGFEQRYIVNEYNIEMSNQYSELNSRCWIHNEASYGGECLLGDISSEKTTIVAGDTISQSFLWIFDEVGKKNKFSIQYFARGGCPSILELYKNSNNKIDYDCNKRNEYLINYINNSEAKKIIFINSWSRYLKQIESFETFEKYLDGTFSKIKKDKEIYIFSQIPYQKINPKLVYNANLNKFLKTFREFNVANFSITDIEHKNNTDEMNHYFNQKKNLNIIYTDKLFCNNLCFIGDERGSFYNDRNHLNFYGTSKLYSTIENEIFLLN